VQSSFVLVQRGIAQRARLATMALFAMAKPFMGVLSALVVSAALRRPDGGGSRELGGEGLGRLYATRLLLGFSGSPFVAEPSLLL
jgi:hypothetical protein